MPTQPKRPLTLRLPPDLYDRLVKAATARGRAPAYLVEDAIRIYLETALVVKEATAVAQQSSQDCRRCGCRAKQRQLRCACFCHG